MTDVHNKKIRSYNMSQVKCKDTKPEIIVRKFLHARGLRYSLHSKNLPGKPDLCFKKYKTLVFINGCFWHGHKNCKYAKLPSTRKDWWKRKIEDTIKRDKLKTNILNSKGWRTLVVWECELKSTNRVKTLEILYLSIIKGGRL